MNNLGNELISANRHVEAVGVLRRAVDINPEYCNSHYSLGRAWYGMARYRESLQSYDRALKCYMEEGFHQEYIADTHYNIGTIYLALKRYPQAEWHFRASLTIQPHNPQARSMLQRALSK